MIIMIHDTRPITIWIDPHCLYHLWGGQHMLEDSDAPPRPSARLLARYCRSAVSLGPTGLTLCNRRSGVILRFSYSAAIQGFSAAADTDTAKGMRGGAARRGRR